jgi:hypothetical protein
MVSAYRSAPPVPASHRLALVALATMLTGLGATFAGRRKAHTSEQARPRNRAIAGKETQSLPVLSRRGGGDMRIEEAIRLVGGSVLVYVIVAACSGGTMPSGPSQSQTGGGGTSRGSGVSTNGGSTTGGVGTNGGSTTSSVGAGGTGTLDASGTGSGAADAYAGGNGGTGTSGRTLMDALTDPVREARADINLSGTRLKVKRYVGADGSSAFQTLHDSQLNVDCYFQLAADGQSRCLPSWPAAASMSIAYSDAKCSNPLAYVFKGCSVPQHAVQNDSTACAWPPTVHVYSIAGPYSGALYSGSPTSCSMWTDGRVTYDFYTVGAELPPNTFVQGTVQIDP